MLKKILQIDKKRICKKTFSLFPSKYYFQTKECIDVNVLEKGFHIWLDTCQMLFRLCFIGWKQKHGVSAPYW